MAWVRRSMGSYSLGVLLGVVIVAGCESKNFRGLPFNEDQDEDGLINGEDNCPWVPNAEQADFDGDGFGDACDGDDDDDLIADIEDNCRWVHNPSQADEDADGVGDACDTGSDLDGDGLGNVVDNCPGEPNIDQTDTDGDGWGDACESDDDNDMVIDLIDNCPLVANSTQDDVDNDGVGDACDQGLDSDNDGHEDVVDNCPLAANSDQADGDGDGLGDVCDDPVTLQSFPGTSVPENNVGEGGWSFPDNGQRVARGLNVFWHGNAGTAIVVYAGGAEELYVHYFDGTGFTPPVQLIGTDEQVGSEGDIDNYDTLQDVRVLFLNTANHVDVNASARNGDAIVLWSRRDVGGRSNGVADSDADANYRLYASYFDVSEYREPVSAGDASVHYGFETQATTLDFDNQQTGATVDDHVTCFGFVSDSLVGSHRFDPQDPGPRLPRATFSGQDTSQVAIVWRKGQRDSAAGSTTGDRIHYLELDLTAAGTSLPTQAAVAAGTVPAAGLAANVGASLVAHNNDLIWLSSNAAGGGAVLLSRFAVGQAPATVELIAGPAVDVPRAEDVYGSDHGLLGLYVAQQVSGNLQVGYSALDAPLAAESLEVDAGSGALTAFDGSRINRTGEWLVMLWRQDVAGTSLLHTNVVQTRHGGATGARALADSVAGAAPMPNQATDQSVVHVTVQAELADGTGDPRRNVQASHDRINWVFQQPDPATPTLHSLVHNGVVVTPSALATARPAVAFTVPGALPEGRVDQTDTTYSPLGYQLSMLPVVTDLGTPEGAPLVYYLRNHNHPTDATAEGAFDEIRVFGWAPGVTPQPVSTVGPLGRFAMNRDTSGIHDYGEYANGQFLRIQTTPIHLDTSAAPDHAGSQVHLFFQEPRGTIVEEPGLRSRRFRKSVFDGANFSAAHHPPLDETPMRLDGEVGIIAYVPPTRRVGDEPGPVSDFITTDGNRVAVYFRTHHHLFYEEFDGAYWGQQYGRCNPQIIDDWGATHLFWGRDQQAYVFGRRLIESADTLTKALVFFAKAPVGEAEYVRTWHARVRD